MEFLLYAIHTGLLFIASALALAESSLKKNLPRTTRTVFLLALGSLLGSIALRILESGRLPFATMYEFGLLMVLTVLLLALLLDFRHPNWNSRAFLYPSSFLLASVILLFFQESRPLMPALKSWWLTSHVLTAVISYGLLAVGTACAICGRIGLALGRTVFAPPEELEKLSLRLSTLAFPFLTLLILTGAVWAEYAWGRFWSWDPKETWALVSWLCYLFLLHATKVRGWKGAKALNLSILAFAVVLFTFFGVNLLLAGLHSYA